MTPLEEIRARDALLHYCATCRRRVYDLEDETDTHNYTVEQCDQMLRKSAIKGGRTREPDPETGHLCGTPSEHHPFVEGDIPGYEQAERDRRWLLQAYDSLSEDKWPDRGPTIR